MCQPNKKYWVLLGSQAAIIWRLMDILTWEFLQFDFLLDPSSLWCLWRFSDEFPSFTLALAWQPLNTLFRNFSWDPCGVAPGKVNHMSTSLTVPWDASWSSSKGDSLQPLQPVAINIGQDSGCRAEGTEGERE